jgi:hypothetical protein
MASGGEASFATAAVRLPTGMLLPDDSGIPQTLAVRAAQLDEHHDWTREFTNKYLDLRDERDLVAWFHFCTGHHVEFLYWQATTVACRTAIAAIGAGERTAAGRWISRVATLVQGSGALLHYCAAFDPSRYDPCLRPSMAAERDDFSGDMSRDFLAMMAARARLDQATEGCEDDYAEALADLKRADRFWIRHHGEVVSKLHPGSSLLRDKLARLQRESGSFDPKHYVAKVVHSERALRDYDEYFGVRRVTDMKIGDYWTQAVEKLATVHRAFAMDAETRTALMRGDGTMLAIISDNLATNSGACANATSGGDVAPAARGR